MVYPPKDGHPSQSQPGSTQSNVVHAVNDATAALDHQSDARLPRIVYIVYFCA